MSDTEFPPPPPPLYMSDSMSYSSSSYIAQNAYYPSPQLHHGPHSHEVSPQPRQESTTRKRPKYTRSKTGCLTCRVKKIKCDEAKPNCMRCTHGQRDCTWPDGVPARKRATSIKDSPDGRPSTESSTASPGTSSPSSTRGHSPPQRAPIELNLPPLLSSRRQESTYLPRMQQHPSELELDPPRRDYPRERGRYSPPESSGSHSHSMLIPEISAYPTQSRSYEQQAYTSTGHHSAHSGASRHTLAASSVRSTMGHPAMQQWSPPPIISPDPYYHPERTLVHSGEQIPRYH
ncbi:hypothetical protein B0H15DRAFT_914264 [Mycena belliarum]|uniref:Zn(2)-C6 fungal-type domain-containing protein n=1 Tax=Mycena belliarum TaxID=1033014 RepID=A0AAD6TTV0_9AGAR|nr:hypothetical protein B0H15DRAFT_914264 [Mycena belliae]